MKVDKNTAELCLFELETKLKEIRVLAVDLLEFAEIGGKIDEVLQLVQLIRDTTTPPRCMLCSQDLEDGEPGEQYICGACLLDPARREQIDHLIKCTTSSTELPPSAAKTNNSDNS